MIGISYYMEKCKGNNKKLFYRIIALFFENKRDKKMILLCPAWQKVLNSSGPYPLQKFH